MRTPLRAGVTGFTGPTEPSARRGTGRGGDGAGDNDEAWGGVRKTWDGDARAGCARGRDAGAGL